MNYEVNFSTSKEMVTFMNCMVLQSPRSVFLVNEDLHLTTQRLENVGDYYNRPDFILRLFRAKFGDINLESKAFYYSCQCLVKNPDLDFFQLIEAIYEGISTGFFSELAHLSLRHYQDLLLYLLDTTDPEFESMLGKVEDQVAVFGIIERRAMESAMLTQPSPALSC